MRYIVLLIILLSTCLAAPPVMVGYYPSWKRAKMDGIDFSKYTHINVAFSIPNEDGTFSFEDDWALPQILSQVRSGGAKALMSVGGWTGSNVFSTILKTESSRGRLLSSMTDYVKSNELDGIDIDWEYPGRLGNDCNVFDTANDTPNFLQFLKDLREKFDSEFGERKKLITLAIRVEPFDINGEPSKDVSEFAKYVDFANLMQYDINGAWNPETGPNAPFNFEAGKAAPMSFVSAIDAWTTAGWPASQLTAGIGFYGRSTTAKQDMTKDPQNQYQPQAPTVPLGDSEDAPWYDKCARTTSNSGTWQWKHLRSQGVLPDAHGSTAAEPWVRQWDPTTQTPWLFNTDKKLFLSYDDPESVRIKSNYAASKGLAGMMVWSVEMDYQGELVDAARSFSGNSTDQNHPSSSSESSTSQNSSLASSSSSTSASSPPSTSASSSPHTSSPSPSSSTSKHVSSKPSATSTSTKPASSSPTPSGDTAPGAPCSDNGKYRCVDPNGHNAAFVVCNAGKQLAASCAPGTVCLSFQSTIMCGWPALKSLVDGVDALFH